MIAMTVASSHSHRAGCIRAFGARAARGRRYPSGSRNWLISEQQIQEAIRGASQAATSIRCIATSNSPDAEFLRAQAITASAMTAKELLLLDLRGYDACVDLDVEKRTVTVQDGDEVPEASRVDSRALFRGPRRHQRQLRAHGRRGGLRAIGV
jgi:hypothetical protein